MAKSTSVTIKGAKELERKLLRLPRATADQVLDDGVKAGGAVFRDEIRRRAPVRRGALKRSVTSRKAKSGVLEAARVVGPRAPHAHLVEYGHLLVWVQPKTRRRYVKGHVPAQPFVRPGAEAGFPGALQAMVTTIGTGIERVATQGAR